MGSGATRAAPGRVLNLPGISLSAVRIADGQSELSGAALAVCHTVLASQQSYDQRHSHTGLKFYLQIVV